MSRPQFLRALRLAQRKYAFAPHGMKERRLRELRALMTEHLRVTVGAKASA